MRLGQLQQPQGDPAWNVQGSKLGERTVSVSQPGRDQRENYPQHSRTSLEKADEVSSCDHLNANGLKG